MDERVNPQAEIVAALISYLRGHPSAADSLDGIVEWWLPRQRYETAKAAIQQALDDLIREGIVEEVILGDGGHLYRLSERSEAQR